MAWLESHQALADHPKTRKLMRILGVSKPTAIGHLHCLWWWALDYADDGRLSRYDALDIAIGAEWEGEPADLVAALVQAGFLDRDGDTLTIHDWDDYAGKLVSRRRQNAQRMRDARAKHESSSMEDDPATYDARAPHVQGTQHARAALHNTTQPTQHDQHNQQDETDVSESDGDAPKRSRLDERFDRFWSAYPNKVGKGAARRIFDRLKPDDAMVDRMIAAIEAQRGSAQWTKDNGQFIPHPSTWLNREGWEDQPATLTTVTNLPSWVTLLPGETVTQVGEGMWDLEDRQGKMRRVRPNYHGVIWDEREHRDLEGQRLFSRLVEAAKTKRGVA